MAHRSALFSYPHALMDNWTRTHHAGTIIVLSYQSTALSQARTTVHQFTANCCRQNSTHMLQ